ncbi:HAMP domain-containing histidine kinase [Ruminococcaceae bacterium OttesenSCG-928-A16]|nr:HAMP domain-containing histidine kinase [Ruminococcaceae bacterium OttesenSCG-928-A16]
MKYAYKLSLIIIVMLALVLSISGYFTISNNFKVSLNARIEQNISQHYLECYALEAELAARIQRFEDTTAQNVSDTARTIAVHTNTTGRWQALYGGDAVLHYANTPFTIDAAAIQTMIASGTPGYLLTKQNGSPLMMLATKVQNVNTDLWFISFYDVASVFNERERQVSFTLQMNVLVLAVATLAAGLASYWFTRPMQKLTQASNHIAAGDYTARSEVNTNDEIGELSDNFNYMAEAVENQVEELNLSIQQRKDFVTAFSHEIKTPMTAIIGYSDMLRFQQTDAETQRRAIRFIYREASRLEALSQKLLLLMGISEEELVLKPTELNLIFRDVMQSIYPLTQNSGISVNVMAADDILVLADRDLIANLLRNLLINAINAEAKGHTVLLRWQQQDNLCEISVQDTGKGIPEEEISRIVEPFYRVDKARAKMDGGTGIGLTLSQKIALLHQTSLQIQSEVRVGTTVSFCLQIHE